MVEDPRIRDFPFTGTAHTHADGISQWLAGITEILGFRVEVRELADGRRLVAPSSDALD